MKTLITNGFIVDGTGEPGYMGSILIEDGKISSLEKADPVHTKDEPFSGAHDGPDVKRVNAKGHVVCPGFIDTHSHSGLKVLEDGYQAPKLLQGITTEIYGQDGVCVAPLPLDRIEVWRKYISGLDGDSDKVDWTFETTEGYLKALEKNGISTNAAYLVPHGNVRLEVMGLSDRAPTDEEIKAMQAVVRREMEGGAIGFSSGLIYIPCAYSLTDELIELCKTVRELDGVFVVHQRSEADEILSSMDEILEIGRQSGVRLHFSHFKACGKKTWDKIPAMLEKLDKAREEGLTVSFDQYPYIAGSTTLSVVFPPWVHVGGAEKMLERLGDEEVLARVEKDIEAGSRGWDNFVDFAGWDGIFITYVKSEKNQNLVGKSLKEIGEIRGVSPLKATADLLIEEKGAASLVDFYGTEEHVKTFLTRPEQNVCTDGLLLGTPHPRVYGSFPRILGKYVREEKVLTLEEAVYKMTGKAAQAFRLKDRGRLAPGMAADLVIFNPDTVLDKGTFENPRQYPEGIMAVMVNGRFVYDTEGMHRIPAGRVLRR